MVQAASAIDRAVDNLFAACAGARAGEQVLIVTESGAATYFDPALASVISDAAGRRGLHVERCEVPFDPIAAAVPNELAARFTAFDHVLFLARLGDQLRFSDMPPGGRPIVSYVLDASTLATPFASGCYTWFSAFKSALDEHFAHASVIRVSCPLGTDYKGRIAPSRKPPADVGIKRFPMSVFAPVPADGFTGRVAVAHFLAGTGSHYYEPYGLALPTPVLALADGNRITGWDGDAPTLDRIREHYERVAGRFGIDAGFVHSWHAGLHPQCRFAGNALGDLERWSGSAFGNPRLLHFHTCGAYAPGEICWNIVDPTIEVDDVAIWEAGRLYPDRFPAGARLIAERPEVARLFDEPCREIGL